MNSYGLFNDLKTDVPDSFLKYFYENGYALVPSVLSKLEVDLLTKHCFHYLDLQELDAISKGIDLKRIKEENLLRCPLRYERNFFDFICLNQKIAEITTSILGKNYQIHLQNAILNKPNMEHHQSSWHRDIPYQPYILSRPMSLNVFICLTDFSEMTGSTYVVPGSHKVPDNEVVVSDLEAKKIPVSMTRGGMILFDSFLWHRAGHNSSSEVRIGVNTVFTTPIIKQQISLPDFLPPDYAISDYEKNLLGYTWASPKSVNEFRFRKKS
jgi:ectoine hydroxylase-related dioxygenase (phytanoyl-CoA dioxygenase family)